MGTTILVLLEINGFIRPENRNLCVSASLILSKKTKWNDCRVMEVALLQSLHCTVQKCSAQFPQS